MAQLLKFTNWNYEELNDFTTVQLRSIADLLEIDFEKNPSKMEIVDAIFSHKGVEKDLSLFTQYQVRYIGKFHYQIMHGPNDLPSRQNNYKFPRGRWVVVDELDYPKYEKYVQGSILEGKTPSWDVQRINPKTNAVYNFYRKVIDKIVTTVKARKIKDLKNIHEDDVTVLNEHNIKTLQELRSMPDWWVAQTLKVGIGVANDILKEATEAMK